MTSTATTTAPPAPAPTGKAILLSLAGGNAPSRPSVETATNEHSTHNLPNAVK